MSLSMYLVGFLIFGTYMYFTIWNIIRSGNKQSEGNTQFKAQEKAIEEDAPNNVLNAES